jgi:hypothetical protein
MLLPVFVLGAVTFIIITAIITLAHNAILYDEEKKVPKELMAF